MEHNDYENHFVSFHVRNLSLINGFWTIQRRTCSCDRLLFSDLGCQEASGYQYQYQSVTTWCRSGIIWWGFVESFRQLWRRILQFVKVWSHCDRHISIYFFASFSYLKEKLLNRHSACLRSVLKYSQFKYASTLSFLLLKVRYFYNYCRVLFWRALVTFWAIKINFLKILERWKLLNYLNGVATENFTIS